MEPRQPIVLTLHGQSGSGKDSTYQGLSKLNPSLERVSFGDLLRDDIAVSLGVKASEIQDERAIDWYPDPFTGEDERMSYKDLMVMWGRYRLLCDPFFYTHQMPDRIHQAADRSHNPLVVVTDCRRPHELQVIRQCFPTYSFRVQFEGSKPMPLDHILDDDTHILTLPYCSLIENVEWIIRHMIRTLPYQPSEAQR